MSHRKENYLTPLFAIKSVVQIWLVYKFSLRFLLISYSINIGKIKLVIRSRILNTCFLDFVSAFWREVKWWSQSGLYLPTFAGVVDSIAFVLQTGDNWEETEPSERPVLLERNTVDLFIRRKEIHTYIAHTGCERLIMIDHDCKVIERKYILHQRIFVRHTINPRKPVH